MGTSRGREFKKRGGIKWGIQHQSFSLPEFFIVLGVSVTSETEWPTEGAGEQADTLVDELSTVTAILS